LDLDTIYRGCPSAPNRFVACSSHMCEIRTCVQGTQVDLATGTCKKCPTGVTILAGRCPCPAELVLNSDKNVCQACPDGATSIIGLSCRCKDSMFFNRQSWSCQPCPGQWKTIETGSPVENSAVGSKRCICTGQNQMFDPSTVSCLTCPPGATPSYSTCNCSDPDQTFNKESGKCECGRYDFLLNGRCFTAYK